MMNVIQIQDRLKSFSEDQLAKEMESPSGSAPQYLVLSEFNRRKRVKADYEQQQNAQQQSSTVAEDVLAASGMPQAGLGALAQNMAPKTDMVQNSGAAPQQTMPMPEAPDAMAEIDPSEGGLAAMAGGGSVKRMAKGGRTQVEYDGRGYFVFDNGEVKDALSRPVSEYLAEAVKASMDESPDATTSTQPLSPTMADESPEAPTLESVLSSDRPFNPLQLSTPQTRDATPSDYGLGADIPDTLAEATAPAINQQQALIDAMSPAFDEFGGDPLAIAEQRSNLSGPSISDVSPTVDLDLTTDQRISQEDMAMAVPVPQGQPRNFTQLLSDIEDPVERAKAILAQSQSDQAQPYVDVGTDPRFGDTMGLQEVLGGDFDPVSDASSKPATPYVPYIPIEPRVGERSIGVGDTFSKAAEAREQGLDMPSGKDPSDSSAMSIEDKITTLDPTQGYPMPQDSDEQSDIGLTEALTGSTFMDLAGSGMDALKAGQQPNLDAAKEAYGDLQMARSIREAEEGSLGGVAPTSAEAAKDIADQTSYSETTNIPDGFTLGTGGDAASNALSFGNLSGLTADSKDGAGKAVLNPDRPTGAPTKPRGGAAPTGVESEILELLKKREEQFDSDKWLALARAGMAMMTSKSSNLLGAIGEGAATGLESLTQSRSAYNDAKLDLLTMRQKLEAARAKGTGSLGASSTNLTSIYNNLTDENTKLRKDIAAADAIDVGTGEPVGNSTLLKQALVKNEMDIDEVKRRLQFKGGVLQTEDVRDGPKTTNKTPSLSEIPELPYALGESVG